MVDGNSILVVVGGVRLTKVQSLNLRRGIEEIPSSVTLTAAFETTDGQTFIFDPIKHNEMSIYLNGKLAFVGVVDIVNPRVSGRSHTVTITARSKCRELVDSSALIPGNQMKEASVKQLAEKLCHPYGIEVIANNPGPELPLIDVNLGEKPWDIIERCAAWSGFIMYDDVQGNLVLTEVGTEQAGGGFQQGVNVQAIDAVFSTYQRFAEIHVYAQALDTSADIRQQLPSSTNSNLRGIAYDQHMPSYRKLFLIGEQFESAESNAQRRANFETMRRWGRSQIVTLTTDRWENDAGNLWEPNTLSWVYHPQCAVNVQNWLIASVEYAIDPSSGTTCNLVLMPPEAFIPTPQVLVAYHADVSEQLRLAEERNAAVTTNQEGDAP